MESNSRDETRTEGDSNIYALGLQWSRMPAACCLHCRNPGASCRTPLAGVRGDRLPRASIPQPGLGKDSRHLESPHARHLPTANCFLPRRQAAGVPEMVRAPQEIAFRLRLPNKEKGAAAPIVMARCATRQAVKA